PVSVWIRPSGLLDLGGRVADDSTDSRFQRALDVVNRAPRLLDVPPLRGALSAGRAGPDERERPRDARADEFDHPVIVGLINRSGRIVLQALDFRSSPSLDEADHSTLEVFDGRVPRTAIRSVIGADD